ncbi:MAG: hypothetical protein LUE64_02375 [Candidatus Gastranaerophilales bacterium]|nr:hypothetical protein [Candidatus Gastranaerophilales bacterium]
MKGYKSSKSLLKYSDADILSPDASSNSEEKCISSLPNQEYGALRVLPFENACTQNPKEYDEKIENFSKEKIRTLFSYFSTSKDNQTRIIDTIYRALEKGNVNSSNLEMLLDLIQDRKLPPPVAFSVSDESSVGINAEKDLDKLYGAYIKKENAADTFIPAVENGDNLEIGDICVKKGAKNISIKMPDSSLKELFISPKTALELFPPVERFAFCQGATGDCYLISALDSCMQNPNTRYKIYSMFRENDNGTVDASYKGFENKNGKVLPKGDFVLEDIETILHKKVMQNPNILSLSCEGARAIELLNEYESEENARAKIMKQYKKFKEFDISSGKSGYQMYRGFKYTNKEIKMFLEMAENGEQLISSSDKNDPKLILTYEDITDAIELLKNEQDNSRDSKYEMLFLERYKERIERENCPFVYFDEILPLSLYYNMFGSEPETLMTYTQGGSAERVYEKMGFDSETTCAESSFIDFLCDKKILNQTIFVAQPKENADNYGIRCRHSYSVEPVINKDGRAFKVRNPYGTAHEITLSEDEFYENFEYLVAAIAR